MTLQVRIDDRRLATLRLARDGARRRVEAALAQLEKARAAGDDPRTLTCSRALHVAQRQLVEAADEIAEAEAAMRLTASLS